MKGVIALALKEMVVERLGADKWQAALARAGIDREPMILPISNVDDQTVLSLVGALCEVLNISLAQAAEAFGDYWVRVYSQKIYYPYYETTRSAEGFLQRLDAIHAAVTRRMPDAIPPRFEYEWRNAKTLIMTYQSQRGLIDFAVGLIKAVGKFYGQDLRVVKLGADRIEVTFP